MVEGPGATKPEDISSSRNEVSKKKGKEEKPPTKVVIRKLPANMPEDSFLDFISPLFEHDNFYYIQDGNPSFGDQSYSRAYINFLNVDDVYTFTVKFDDYVFIDDIGQEYPAIVEYAPFQRIPKSRGNRKSDPFCGTIEEDPDYQEFVRQLQSEMQDKNSQMTEHYFDLVDDENEEKITTTPLIEYLTSRKNEYIKYKEEKKEERRRREIERKKLKEESRRVKKDKDILKTKIIEKPKEEKKTFQDSKIFEEITSGARVRGKSYQEERQRDLARRKLEEKSIETDDNKENNKIIATEKLENEEEKNSDNSDSLKPHIRADCRDDNFHKKNLDDKRSHREEDRRSNYYSRDKEDKKYSYGVKKREFVGGYDYDAKYSKNKSTGYFYDDYKNRSHNTYQKSAHPSGKYTKSKEHHDEKNLKRFESKSKKYEYVDYRDRKSQKEIEKKYAISNIGGNSLNSDLKIYKSASKDDYKIMDTNYDYKCEGISRNSSKQYDNHSGSTSEIEGSKSEEIKKSRKENDPRAERRIKNKDRPALEIYRPGMGKFSRQRLERNKSSESKECD